VAKNRKNESVVLRFGPALKAFALIAVIGGASVGYVWQKGQIELLGRQIKEREMRLAELRDQNKKLRDNLAMMRSPAMLEQRMNKLNLGMVMPQAKDVWRVAEPLARPVSVTARTASVQQVASR
jgi:cell division protein FtsB